MNRSRRWLMWGRPDTKADIEERIRTKEIAQQVWKEVCERWPTLSPENVEEAMVWMDKRVNELKSTQRSVQ